MADEIFEQKVAALIATELKNAVHSSDSSVLDVWCSSSARDSNRVEVSSAEVTMPDGTVLDVEFSFHVKVDFLMRHYDDEDDFFEDDDYDDDLEDEEE